MRRNVLEMLFLVLIRVQNYMFDIQMVKVCPPAEWFRYWKASKIGTFCPVSYAKTSETEPLHVQISDIWYSDPYCAEGIQILDIQLTEPFG